MSVFEKLKRGEPVDMMSEEYHPAVVELHRADRALFHLNHTEPHTEEWNLALAGLFDGSIPDGLGLFTPTNIDFPKQITFGKHVFIIPGEEDSDFGKSEMNSPFVICFMITLMIQYIS